MLWSKARVAKSQFPTCFFISHGSTHLCLEALLELVEVLINVHGHGHVWNMHDTSSCNEVDHPWHELFHCSFGCTFMAVLLLEGEPVSSLLQPVTVLFQDSFVFSSILSHQLGRAFPPTQKMLPFRGWLFFLMVVLVCCFPYMWHTEKQTF